MARPRIRIRYRLEPVLRLTDDPGAQPADLKCQLAELRRRATDLQRRGRCSDSPPEPDRPKTYRKRQISN